MAIIHGKDVLEYDKKFLKELEEPLQKIKVLIDLRSLTSEIHDHAVLLRGLLVNWFQNSPSSHDVHVELLLDFLNRLNELLLRRDDDHHPMWYELAFLQAHALSFLIMTLLKARDSNSDDVDVKRSLFTILTTRFFPLGDLIVKNGDPEFFERFTLGFNLLNMRFKIMALMIENFSSYLSQDEIQQAASKVLDVSRQQLDLLEACWDVEAFYRHAKRIQFSSVFHPHAFFMYVPLQVLSILLILGRHLSEKTLFELSNQFFSMDRQDTVISDLFDQLLRVSRNFLSDVVDGLKLGLFDVTDDPFVDPHFDLAIRMITDLTLVTWGLNILFYPEKNDLRKTLGYPDIETIVTNIVEHLASSRALHEDPEFVYSGAGLEYAENLYYFFMIIGYHALKSKNDKIFKMIPELLPLCMKTSKGEQLYPDLHYAWHLISLALDVSRDASSEDLKLKLRQILALSEQSRLIPERRLLARLIGLAMLYSLGEKTSEDVVSDLSEYAKQFVRRTVLQNPLQALLEQLFMDHPSKMEVQKRPNGFNCMKHAFHVESFLISQILTYLSRTTTTMNVETLLDIF